MKEDIKITSFTHSDFRSNLILLIKKYNEYDRLKVIHYNISKIFLSFYLNFSYISLLVKTKDLTIIKKLILNKNYKPLLHYYRI